MHRALYKIARKINKAATTLNDLSVWSTGDPKKIAKRYARKHAYKASYSGGNSLARNIVKFLKLK